MLIRGIINYEGKQIHLTEHTIEQIVFQRKDKVSNLIITTIINDKPISFREDQIEELSIAHIATTESTLEYEAQEDVPETK